MRTEKGQISASREAGGMLPRLPESALSHIAELIAAENKYNIDAVAALAAAIDSSLYAQKLMAGKPRFGDRLQLLEYAVSRVSLPGLFLEFGVNDGTTIRHISSKAPNQKVFGFDSFEGLPESWSGAPIGHFAQPKLPEVGPNVELVKGWFDRSLPPFLDGISDQPVAFLHVDCDLYSSTQTVLAQLRNNIVSGTIIVFDEYFNYPDWRQHEHRAFQEFVESTNKKYDYIGLVPAYEHVAVRIL
jgi:Macrocin-O-methyltransferase (TylF)